MRGGCLLAVGARRAQGSNKFSSVQLSSLLQYPPPFSQSPTSTWHNETRGGPVELPLTPARAPGRQPQQEGLGMQGSKLVGRCVGKVKVGNIFL